MTKKKTSSKKQKKETKKSEEEKIAGSKHFSDEKRKETKLEEEIEQAEKKIGQSAEPLANPPLASQIKEDFFEESIRQIPISTEIKSPVLERIIQRQEPAPIQEFTNQQEEAREEVRINYSPINEPNYSFARNKEEDEEKKYETNFVPPVLTRREFSPEIRREFLKQPENVWGNQTNEPQLDEIGFIEEETRLPFEEQQKKYKRAKLR